MNTLVSILKFKCPKCHKGDLFVDKNPYHFSKLTVMHKTCKCCGQQSEPEPGFYFGAMYVSYGLGTMIFLLNFFMFAVIWPLSDLAFISLNTLLMLVLWPVLFRLARVIYFNIFVGYDPEAGN